MPFTVVEATNPIYQTLKQDILINADYWFYTPKIIGAGLGFTQILGVPGVDTTPAGQQAVIDAGGAWEVLSTTNSNPVLRAYTSATNPKGMEIGYGKAIVGGGGMPVEFSWPVLPSTVDGSDFEVTLNTGKKVIAQAASINPLYRI